MNDFDVDEVWLRTFGWYCAAMVAVSLVVGGVLLLAMLA